MTFIEALLTLRPGAEWSLSGETYDCLVWLDQVQQKPTEQEIISTMAGATPAQVDAERDRRIKTLTFNGHLFDFCDDKGSSDNISGAATLALAAITAGAQPGNLRWSNPDRDFAWIAHDNSLVTMDAQTMLAFGMHAADTKAAHIYAARVIKNMSPIPVDFAADSRWPS